MMLATKFFVWIFLMFLIAEVGTYVYFETFVDGSMTGLNPLGALNSSSLFRFDLYFVLGWIT